jgi:hypothetical protein
MNSPRTPEELFGFKDFIQTPPQLNGENEQNYYDSSIQVTRINSMMNELMSLGNVKTLKPQRLFENMINYGTEAGALQVAVSPYGSLKIQVRNLVYGDDGNPYYVLRKCIPLVNDFNHFHSSSGEEIIAGYVYDVCNKIVNESLQYPNNKYKKLEDLAKFTGARLREQHPIIMMYNSTFRENENYYTYHFDFRGNGVEAPSGSGSKVLEFVAHLSYYPESGMLRSWGNDITTTFKNTSWRIQPSEWDEYFAPSQDKKDISEQIVKMLSTY